MPRIAISYRRDDSLDITGRIFDRLAGHFGREAVFRDIDSIPLGVDFRRHIDRVLDDTDIILAIVGPRWIGPANEQLRLASPADPVRLEIETALSKDKPLIPVLVSRAVMPHPDVLPESLSLGLTRGVRTRRSFMGIRRIAITAAFGVGLATLPLSTAKAQYYPPCSPFPLEWPFCVVGAVVGTAAMIVTAPIRALTGAPPFYYGGYYRQPYYPPPAYYAPGYYPPSYYYGPR